MLDNLVGQKTSGPCENGRRVTDACEPVQDPGLARRTFSCGPDRIVIDACEKNANPGFDNLVDRSTFGPKG